METQKSDANDRSISITRTLNAPIEMVWELWIDPNHLAQWWGPNGFTNTISKMDLRPGGEWNLVMHGPDGTDYDNKSIFREVTLHKRIVYEHINWPHFRAIIEFEPQGDKTLLNWTMHFESRELLLEVVQKHKADTGLVENIRKLVAYVAGYKERVRSEK